jgi:hypothetical protein
MTQHPVFVGIKMAFLPIGDHVDLILNRLRNKLQIAEHNESDDEWRKDQDRAEEEARTKLAFIKKRLAELAAFERRARGLKK